MIVVTQRAWVVELHATSRGGRRPRDGVGEIVSPIRERHSRGHGPIAHSRVIRDRAQHRGIVNNQITSANSAVAKPSQLTRCRSRRALQEVRGERLR